jgi:hypothetical protein
MSVQAETRERLRKTFNLSRSGCTEVVDNQLITDGTTHKDLEALTKERLLQFCKINMVLANNEENIFSLFEKVVKDLERQIKEEKELAKPAPKEVKTTIEVKNNADGTVTLMASTTNKQVETINQLKCPQCDFVGKNANGVRLHAKKHK